MFTLVFLNKVILFITQLNLKRERIGRIVQMHANDRQDVEEIRAGDIAACVGLKDVTTGDTLCDEKKCHHT